MPLGKSYQHTLYYPGNCGVKRTAPEKQPHLARTFIQRDIKRGCELVLLALALFLFPGAFLAFAIIQEASSIHLMI